MLKLYNTLSRSVEPFQSKEKGRVGLYVCGMTVYDYCHVGHARVFVCFDMIARYLRHLGYEVTYVRNITDIDDKIIARAIENGESLTTLTKRFINAMHEDEDLLAVDPPTHEPKATEYIPGIIALIEKILAKDAGYVADNGDVYFSVGSFENYGQLANQSLDQLQSGSRVSVNEAKRDPLDFVLWKMAKSGEPSWDSPWGPGRPGWHIECSAMSTSLLGESFDIHGGGVDLVFPHHQNEVAQSESVSEHCLANYWMHVGHVQVDSEKMSKSLGNFFTIREVLKSYHPEVIRYFMLASHYRSPVNYTQDNLDSAYQALTRGYQALRDLVLTDDKGQSATVYQQQFEQAMSDDFNTPRALAVLFDLIREINRLKQAGELKAATSHAKYLIGLGELLGLFQQGPAEFFQGELGDDDTNKIDDLMNQRQQARDEKNWPEADRLRLVLDDLGVVIEDTSNGAVWRKK